MAHPNPIRRMLDAGLQLSELTQSNAERIVGELVKAGEVRRKDAEKTVREMLENNREAAERFGVAVRDEVARQLTGMAGRIEQLESLMSQLVPRLTPSTSASAGDAPGTSAMSSASSPAPAPAKKAPATKAAPKKQAAAKQQAPPTPSPRRASRR